MASGLGKISKQTGDFLMQITMTDWKTEICLDINSRNIEDWLKTNCLKIIVNLPDDHKDWKEYHYLLFLKAICEGIPNNKK